MSDSFIAERVRQTEVVIWTPVGRDAALIASVLQQVQVRVQIVSDLSALCRIVGDMVNAVIILSEETLPSGHIACLRKALDTQPHWSDIPFIVLTSAGRTTQSNFQRFIDIMELGHVTMLERPVRTATLLAAARSAMRSRYRQFQTKEYLQQRLRAEEEVNKQAGDLARSNADLQRFAYVTSHDLREPLRNIMAYAQLLQRRCGPALDGDGTKYVEVILQGAQRMEALTQDLLSYSRLANGGDVPFKPVCLDSVLNWATANLERALTESGTELIADPLPTILGDEVQLVQLFQNLLSNAIKYRRPEVQNCVTIAAQRVDSSCILTFRDNGRGFHPDYREHIFGLFKRLDGREVPGTGIGLAICKTIVQKHGGSIWAEGIPGEGAAFHVSLPVMTESS